MDWSTSEGLLQDMVLKKVGMVTILGDNVVACSELVMKPR
jgi:hypothetical protein